MKCRLTGRCAKPRRRRHSRYAATEHNLRRGNSHGAEPQPAKRAKTYMSPTVSPTVSPAVRSKTRLGLGAGTAAVLASAACLIGTAARAESADPSVPLYRATYGVQYKGRNVGSSEFSVAYDEASARYVFESNTRVKGLLRFVSPNPAIEHSEFVVDHGALRPLSFRYEDGSRKGEDNYTASFDWQAGVVRIDRDGGPRELELTAGVLDRGSLQVSLMRDMALGGALGPYVLADDDSLTTYEAGFDDSGDVSTDTELGRFETRRFVQHREGSSRSTVLSVAPALRYLPVKIEQIRNGEAETVFTLEGLAGIPLP
jgi:Protein of unknown function (DUF3108)